MFFLRRSVDAGCTKISKERPLLTKLRFDIFKITSRFSGIPRASKSPSSLQVAFGLFVLLCKKPKACPGNIKICQMI
jgi:hypothetical protein